MRFLFLILLAVHAGLALATRGPTGHAEDACRDLAGRLASVSLADCLSAGFTTTENSSVRGRPILWRDFAPSDGQVPERRVLLVGGIHGDEFSSVSIVFKWVRFLRAATGDRYLWRVLPSLNPDGLLRKPATRMNANGVDLNRNFPSPGWSERAPQYWKARTGGDPRRFPGDTAASEPEVRTLVEQIQSFRPDVLVSIHAPFGVLDYDGPHDPPKRIGYLRLHQLGTYPGSLGEYAGQFLGVPVVTMELPHAGIMPTEGQIEDMWTDLVAWIGERAPDLRQPVPVIAPIATYRLLPSPELKRLPPVVPSVTYEVAQTDAPRAPAPQAGGPSPPTTPPWLGIPPMLGVGDRRESPAPSPRP